MNPYLFIFHQVKREWKHVRFKSTSNDFNISDCSSKTACKIRIQALASKLDCNTLTAQEIVAKNRNILSLESDEFYRNVMFCQKHLKLSEVVEYPHILSMNSSLLQHRYFSLMELGCKQVSASNILRFTSILKKSHEALTKDGLSFAKDDLTALSMYLDQSEKADFSSRLHHMYRDGCSLKQIKEAMNAEFLVAKLGCSIGRAHQMFKSYPPLRVQSISKTDQILNILLLTLGFSPTMIYRCLNLLSLHPESVETFLSQIPHVLGVGIKHILQREPIMLRKPVQAIQEVESVLKNFTITDAQLMCCPKILIFSPSTLTDRLGFLCQSKDFLAMKSFKKFLWLVYNFGHLDSRLQALKELDIPASVNMFMVSSPCFEKYLRFSKPRSHVQDVCSYLAELFKVNEKDIVTMLRGYHSHRDSSLSNCQRVVEFLLEAGVTKEQIFRGIGIIFYDADIVEEYFRDLRNLPECQPFDEWIVHYNLVQLLIYTIEADVGFQGSRLFKAKGGFDEEELLLNYSSN